MAETAEKSRAKKSRESAASLPESRREKDSAAAPEKTVSGRKASGSKTSGRKSAASSGKRASAGNMEAKPAKLRTQEESEIFALDIGTRNVVGIIGHMADGNFCVDHAVSIPHKNRAMIDGQIEDIPEVARIAGIVKDKLEKTSGIKLSRVAIAAAGRALKTKRTQLSFNVEEKDSISADDVKSFELECALKAQDELDAETGDISYSFYCVGHTVVKYLLDDYQIKSLIGHKGKKASVELIAAFLPGTVVESLYAVTDMTGLEVASLTLEPIAAMNIIIPPDVRLINIALVDIGAGTSDIAISQNGSIVAYAMSTVAGDEITEEIIKQYIVDFSTAEKMKLSGGEKSVSYKDILGFEHNIDTKEFFASLSPAVELLASDISANIISANGQAPAAVFLVGGGSLVPGLAKLVSEKLGIPENRVAVGGQDAMKNVDLGKTMINGPEYVTPVGIGITAAQSGGYDFSVVSLNGKKVRIFDTRAVRILDLLMAEGYKSSQLIGRTGRNLNFTLNGEKQFMKGETAVAAEVTVNGETASLETQVRQGDVIEFRPADSGKNAEAKISDIAGDVSARYVYIDGADYPFGIIAMVNGRQVTSDYMIQNFDSVTISEIETLGELMQSLPFDTANLDFYKSGKLLSIDYLLRDNDDIITDDKPEGGNSGKVGALAKAAAENRPAVSGIPVSEVNAVAEAGSEEIPEAAEDPGSEEISEPETEPVSAEEPAVPEVSEASEVPEVPEEPAEEKFRIVLNGKSIVLEPRPNNLPHEFIELMALAEIDLDNPPRSGEMILTVNGREASFMDVLHNGDTAVVRWADN